MTSTIRSSRFRRATWPERTEVSWDGVEVLPADLFIFDLDGTLVDTSGLVEARELARRRGDWGPVRAAMDRVKALRVWGDVAPHELPGVLRQYGYRVSVISRAPRWYVERIVEDFEIEADEIVWALRPQQDHSRSRTPSAGPARKAGADLGLR